MNRTLLALMACLTLLMAGCQSERALTKSMFQQAEQLWRANDYANAASILISLAHTHPTAPQADKALFLGASLQQFFLDNNQQAEQLYQQLLIRYPSSPYVPACRDNLATLYEDDNSLTYRAIQMYNYQLKDPNAKSFWEHSKLKLGTLNIKLQRLYRARNEFLEFLEQFPNSELVSQVLHYVAQSYYLEQRYNEAHAILKRIAQRFAGTEAEYHSLLFRVRMYEEQGELRQAYDLLNNANTQNELWQTVYQRHSKNLEQRMKQRVY